MKKIEVFHSKLFHIFMNRFLEGCFYVRLYLFVLRINDAGIIKQLECEEFFIPSRLFQSSSVFVPLGGTIWVHRD